MAVRGLAWFLSLPAILLAQAPAPSGGARIAAAAWSADQSRDLFRGCDRNGDDRLDLFEARAAIEAAADLAAFRRLDRDRDGYIDWPEFDRFYRDLVRGGDTLRLRLLRPPASATTAAHDVAPRQPPQRLIELFDVDRSGALEPAEIEAMLREFDLPPAFAATLRNLDRNHDGKLEESELAPVMTQFQLAGMFTARLQGSAPGSTLPPPWSTIDRNGDGNVDVDELAAALRRLDPELARWAAIVLKTADRNGNGSLSVDELVPAALPTSKAGAGKTEVGKAEVGKPPMGKPMVERAGVR